MAKISTVTMHGKSGQMYAFDCWNTTQAFNPVAAVYVFTLRYQRDTVMQHKVLYVGETEDLSTRFDNHHKEQSIKAQNANCICTHLERDADMRLAIERDLIAYYDPECNG